MQCENITRKKEIKRTMSIIVNNQHNIFILNLFSSCSYIIVLFMYF